MKELTRLVRRVNKWVRRRASALFGVALYDQLWTWFN